MKIYSCILVNNDCFRRGRTIVPKGVMVHSTGANNPELRRYVAPDDGRLGTNRYGNDWNRSGLDVCVHAFIGRLADGTVAVYQTLPWNHRGWHAGGSANDTHISFEICEDGLEDPAYFQTVYQQAAELTAQLCRRFGLDPLQDGVILDHKEGNDRGIASAHGDVAHWFPRFGKSMDHFRRDVAEILKGDTIMTQDEVRSMIRQELDALQGRRYQTLEEIPAWGRPAIRAMTESGVLQGTEKGLNLSEDLLRTLVILDRAQRREETDAAARRDS